MTLARADLRAESGSQSLDEVIAEQTAALLAAQRSDGHWVFEFEADATIPAEYVMLRHFLGALDDDYLLREQRIVAYLRSIQGEDGGWPLFHGGNSNISATVKAYFALKLAGADPEAAHMLRAREKVLTVGGAAQANVFTRFALALFEQVPWRAVPAMPVEIMLLPRWFPFHLEKVSYWSRTVIVPLLILMALKPKAANPRGVSITELFREPPERADYPLNPTGTWLGALFKGLDRLVRLVEPAFPHRRRARAIAAALAFIRPRLNGEDGLGGIFPAMANTVMAFHALGLSERDPDVATARRSVEKLLLQRADGETYCQPCLSPVWDTCLAYHALLEAGLDGKHQALLRAADWLLEREVTEPAGDWSWRRPNAAPGGWPFQYRNDYYPDVDDTAVVVAALERAAIPRTRPAIERAEAWVLAMQSRNGGWGAFDADNTHSYLNYIPFADHGALLDPPTVDVSARCLSMLAQLGYRRDHPAVERGLVYLRREQEADGSWYGRWGVNYVYGTWSALAAFSACGEDMAAPHIRKAVAWLKAFQREDGGWGEDCATYWSERRGEAKASTPSQTAWALLGLMAAGEIESEAVERGIAYLLAVSREGACWREAHYTGVGFQRVFYLKYHGYSAYFPLWALARYRNMKRAGITRVRYGL